MAEPRLFAMASCKLLSYDSNSRLLRSDNDTAMGLSDRFTLDQALGARFIRPDTKDRKAG